MASARAGRQAGDGGSSRPGPIVWRAAGTRRSSRLLQRRCGKGWSTSRVTPVILVVRSGLQRRLAVVVDRQWFALVVQQQDRHEVIVAG